MESRKSLTTKMRMKTKTDLLRIGPVQARLLGRALASRERFVYPGGFLERRACWRLEDRGILIPVTGLPDVWRFDGQLYC